MFSGGKPANNKLSAEKHKASGAKASRPWSAGRMMFTLCNTPPTAGLKLGDLLRNIGVDNRRQEGVPPAPPTISIPDTSCSGRWKPPGRREQEADGERRLPRDFVRSEWSAPVDLAPGGESIFLQRLFPGLKDTGAGFELAPAAAAVVAGCGCSDVMEVEP
mmetsp:Transcript_16326/g.57020  ORF Transcript_16326/g.57020 Transcript_16326/m.57020 type:complete len:161 (-) Transcript_16326:622-1104(-)